MAIRVCRRGADRSNVSVPAPLVKRERFDAAGRMGGPMAGDTLRVGIISANWGVAAHLPAWRAHPDIEVAGICTAHQETAEAAAAANHIPRAFWDYRRMSQDPDID